MFTDVTLEPSQLSRKDLPWQIVWDQDRCTLCGRCSAVCPVQALAPGVFRRRVVQDGFGLHTAPVNAYQVFYGIRQQTDPSLDAGRHEFEFRTLLGRVLPPEDSLRLFKGKGWMPPVQEIYPLIIGSMSFGALSPSMWEGLLMGNKVNRLIAAIRGVPQGVNLPSPPTHQTKYSIEEAVAKMVQSMYMAWGFRVPVYPKISGTSTSLAVLNNLTRNPYAGGLSIDATGMNRLVTGTS